MDVFSLPQAHLLNRTGCTKFNACLHCRFTICSKEILAKNV